MRTARKSIFIGLCIILNAMIDSAQMQESPNIALEKQWQKEWNTHQKVVMDNQTGNIIVYEDFNITHNDHRILILGSDGQELTRIQLDKPILNVSGDPRYIKAKNSGKLDEFVLAYDDKVGFSEDGRYMGKIRVAASGSECRRTRSIELYQLIGTTYEKLWECPMHSLKNLSDPLEIEPEDFIVDICGRILFVETNSFNAFGHLAIMYENGTMKWRRNWREGCNSCYGKFIGISSQSGDEIIYFTARKEISPSETKAYLVGLTMNGEEKWSIPYSKFPEHLDIKLSRNAIFITDTERTEKALFKSIKSVPFRIVFPDGSTREIEISEITPIAVEFLNSDYLLIYCKQLDKTPILSTTIINRFKSSDYRPENDPEASYEMDKWRNDHIGYYLVYDLSKNKIIHKEINMPVQKHHFLFNSHLGFAELEPIFLEKGNLGRYTRLVLRDLTKDYPVELDPNLSVNESIDSLIVNQNRILLVTEKGPPTRILLHSFSLLNKVGK